MDDELAPIGRAGIRSVNYLNTDVPDTIFVGDPVSLHQGINFESRGGKVPVLILSPIPRHPSFHKIYQDLLALSLSDEIDLIFCPPAKEAKNVYFYADGKLHKTNIGNCYSPSDFYSNYLTVSTRFTDVNLENFAEKVVTDLTFREQKAIAVFLSSEYKPVEFEIESFSSFTVPGGVKDYFRSSDEEYLSGLFYLEFPSLEKLQSRVSSVLVKYDGNVEKFNKPKQIEDRMSENLEDIVYDLYVVDTTRDVNPDRYSLIDKARVLEYGDLCTDGKYVFVFGGYLREPLAKLTTREYETAVKNTIYGLLEKSNDSLPSDASELFYPLNVSLATSNADLSEALRKQLFATPLKQNWHLISS